MGLKSIPSRLVYTVDVPEITNLDCKFVYNYFVYNESIRDKDVLNDPALRNTNLSQDIISKSRDDLAESYMSYADKRFPRYVKITFNHPSKVQFAEKSKANNLIKNNLNKIMTEEQFASSYYTTLNFKNGSIDKQTASIFNSTNMALNVRNSSVDSYSKTRKNAGNSDLNVVENVDNQKEYARNVIYKKNDGTKVKNEYLDSLKSVSSNIQISNNILHDLVQRAANNPFTLNKDSYKSLRPVAKSKRNKNNNYYIHDDEFKTSVDYYKTISSADDDVSAPASFTLVGYIVDKIEMFTDGTQKFHNPIIIENPRATSYLDLDIRYGTVYVYHVRSVMEAIIPAVDNDSVNVTMVGCLFSSKPQVTSVETTENISPPAPVELKFMWDYDRINPTTAQFDRDSNKIFPNTGDRGSLMLHWSFPVNSQMDIKKFQIFRRKRVEDPFELIKVYDFNDASVKFPDDEKNINEKVIETSADPQLRYYDDEFLKNSEFIYTIASVDAHGMSSNYSEQFHVSFDRYANKIKTKLISTANAPKSYPNLHIQQDLFIDSIKTSDKKTLHMYFTPEAYTVKNAGVENRIVGTSRDKVQYKINFINIENQKSMQLTINLNDRRLNNRLRAKRRAR